jgi:hypothetical protein
LSPDHLIIPITSFVRKGTGGGGDDNEDDDSGIFTAMRFVCGIWKKIELAYVVLGYN